MLVLPRKMHQGKVLFRSLIALFLLSLLAAAVFLYVRNKDIERQKEEHRLRVAQAELQLERDVERALNEAEEALEEEEFEKVKSQLRRASMLDTSGKYAELCQSLKLRYETGIKQAAWRNAAVKIRVALKQERFADAEAELALCVDTIEVAQREAMQKSIAQGKKGHTMKCLKALDEAMNHWDVAAAETVLSELERSADAAKLKNAMQLFEGFKKRRAAAVRLAQEITTSDAGTFSRVLHDRLQQALNSYNDNPNLLALQKKFERYLLEVNVPGDFSTLEEALTLVPVGAKITLGDGVFFADVVIDKAVSLIGQGPERTFVEGVGMNRPVLHLVTQQGKIHITNLQVRAVGNDEANNAQPLLRIAAESVHIENTHICEGLGHGLEIQAGTVDLNKVVVRNNLRDGIAMHGANVNVRLNDSLVTLNGEHGVDAWDGADVHVKHSTVTSNAKAGVVAVGGKTKVALEDAVISLNSQVGCYVNQGAQVGLKGVELSHNGYSGLCLQGAKSAATLEQVRTLKNGEYGLLIDPRASLDAQNLTHEENGLGEKLLRRLR